MHHTQTKSHNNDSHKTKTTQQQITNTIHICNKKHKTTRQQTTLNTNRTNSDKTKQKQSTRITS